MTKTQKLQIVNADKNDHTGSGVKEKANRFPYTVHYNRRIRQWSVTTSKQEHFIDRFYTSDYYYVNGKPYRFLRDAILQILIADDVI